MWITAPTRRSASDLAAHFPRIAHFSEKPHAHPPHRIRAARARSRSSFRITNPRTSAMKRRNSRRLLRWPETETWAKKARDHPVGPNIFPRRTKSDTGHANESGCVFWADEGVRITITRSRYACTWTMDEDGGRTMAGCGTFWYRKRVRTWFDDVWVDCNSSCETLVKVKESELLFVVL